MMLSTWLIGSRSVVEAQVQAGSHVNYTNITTDGTFTIKPAPGILHAICINNAVATETVTIFDNTTNSGTKIGTINIVSTADGLCLQYHVSFNVGLTIVTAVAASDLTVVWE